MLLFAFCCSPPAALTPKTSSKAAPASSTPLALVNKRCRAAGDTIDIHGKRIRLWGIDAPEQRQRCYDEQGQAYRCGKDSAFHLDDMIKGAVVRCDQRDVDRYKRIISECFFTHPDAGEININATMMVPGHALAYRKYSTDYVTQEDKARSLKRGMWRGEFLPPWEWRKH